MSWNNFGPWATTLDTGPGAPLSTFWQRRMAMLAMLDRTNARVSWTLRAVIAVGALAVLALPIVYFSGTSVQAEDGKEKKTETFEAAGKEPETEFLPLPSKSELRFLAALEEPTTINFTETPLQDVVDYLKSAHKIEIQLHTRALEDVAIGSDTPVTCHLKDVNLASALNLLLTDMDLTYIIKNEVLLITTKDMAATELLTRTYPVGDLVEPKGEDKLIKAITSTVQPMTWDEVGGPGSIVFVPAAKSFVISQLREVHDEVLTLLRALRSARKVSAAESQ